MPASASTALIAAPSRTHLTLLVVARKAAPEVLVHHVVCPVAARLMDPGSREPSSVIGEKRRDTADGSGATPCSPTPLLLSSLAPVADSMIPVGGDRR
jgi:hypothetical protein